MPISPPPHVPAPFPTHISHPIATLEDISAPTAIEHIYPLSPTALHQRIDDMKAGRIPRVQNRPGSQKGKEGLSRKDSLDKAAGIRERARLRAKQLKIEEKGVRSQTPFLVPRLEASVYSLNSEYSLGKERGGSVLYGMMPERYVDDGDNDEEKEVVVPNDPAVKKSKRKSALVKSVGRTMGCRPGSVTPVFGPVSSGQGTTTLRKGKWYKSLPRGFKFKTKQVKGAANGDEEDVPGRSSSAAKGGKSKLESKARKKRDEERKVESSDTSGLARLVDPETLSSTIRRAPESPTSFGSPVSDPRVVEHTSPSSLPSSRIGSNNPLPDRRREHVEQLHTREAKGLSESIKRPESRRGNRHPCASSPIPTNNFLDLRETSIFSPQRETEDQAVARLRQRLDEVEQEAGKRAWEDIYRRRDRSTVNESGYDLTTIPRYQRRGSREDVHEHVSREIERLRRGFVASQMNAPCQEEEDGGRYGLPTRAEPQHTFLSLDPGVQPHQQPAEPREIFPTTTTAIPEARKAARQAALSPGNRVRTTGSKCATPTPPLRRVRHTIPSRNLAPSPLSTRSHQIHPPTKSRTYDASPNTPEDRHAVPSTDGADAHPHPHSEKVSPTVHEWAQDEQGKWALREVSDGEEDRPRPARGFWRDV